MLNPEPIYRPSILSYGKTMEQTSPPRGTQALDRGLALLMAIVASRGQTSLTKIASDLGLAISTAHRLVARLEETGMVIRTGRGRYRAGLQFAHLAAHIDIREAVALAGRPILKSLARETGRTAHLGLLDQDMVTYLVKEAPPRQDMFTRETMQLEAYCSAVGKVLLAQLPEAEREAYLTNGPFIELTPNTIIDPDRLRQHLAGVRKDQFAFDDNEIEVGLFCIAVPVHTGTQQLSLAMSSSGANLPEPEAAALLQRLREISVILSQRLGARDLPPPAASDERSPQAVH